MAFIKKIWKNRPDVSTPLNADGMNDLENRLAQELDDTGWITLNSSIKYRRKNGVVTVAGQSSTINAGPNANAGTLPVGFRPNIDIRGPMAAGGSTSLRSSFQFIIYETGSIISYADASQSSSYWSFLISFPI